MRTISGIPGSAVLGRPLAACGPSLAGAAVSAASDYLLATTGEDRRVVLCRNLSGEPAPSILSGAPAGPDRILLSPNGSAAVLLYAAPGKLILVSGLPGTPAFSNADLPAGARLLAVSDSATALTAGPGGRGESLALVSAGSSNPLGGIGHAAAAAFLNGRDEAIVADDLHNTVYLAGASGIQTLATERDGIAGPAAVAVSADNREAVVASATSGKIARLSLAGGVPGLIGCDCKPAAFERLQGNAVFRIVTGAEDALLVYDGDNLNARIVVIPPETGGARGGPEAGRTPGNGRAR